MRFVKQAQMLVVISFQMTALIASSGCGVKQYGTKKNLVGVPAYDLNAPLYASGQKGDTFQSMSSAGCLSTCNHGGVARMQASIGIPLHFDTNPNTAVQNPTATQYTAGVYNGTADVNGKGVGRSKTINAPNSKNTMLGNKDLQLIQKQQR